MITRSANQSLVIIGSVALDDVDGPFGKQVDLLGGSASFLCTAASYFTKHVSVIAVVGEDFQQRHLDDFAASGVDISGIERAPGKTFHWAGKYADDLATRKTLDTQLGVFADFKPKLHDAHRSADLVCLGNIDPVLQLEVLEQCTSAKLVAADTMNFWITGKRKELLRTLERVHTLLINEEEARLLADEHNLIRAATKILRMGPHSLIIKRGDAGALLVYDGGVFAAPAMPLEDVRDPTGAGDSFAGGFMGYLAYAGDLSPDTIRTAMITGSVMASFSVEKFSLDGLRGLTQKMIQDRFDAFADLTRFESIRL